MFRYHGKTYSSKTKGFFQMSFSDILSTGVSRNRSSQPVKAVRLAANNPQRIYFLRSITIRFKKLDLET